MKRIHLLPALIAPLIAACALAPPALAQSQASFYAGWPTILPYKEYGGYGGYGGYDYGYNYNLPPVPAAPSGLDLTTQRAIPQGMFVEWAPDNTAGYARVIPHQVQDYARVLPRTTRYTPMWGQPTGPSYPVIQYW